MNIEEIKKNAPSWANCYIMEGNSIKYCFLPIKYNIGVDDGLMMQRNIYDQFNEIGAIPLI